MGPSALFDTNQQTATCVRAAAAAAEEEQKTEQRRGVMGGFGVTKKKCQQKMGPSGEDELWCSRKIIEFKQNLKMTHAKGVKSVCRRNTKLDLWRAKLYVRPAPNPDALSPPPPPSPRPSPQKTLRIKSRRGCPMFLVGYRVLL